MSIQPTDFWWGPCKFCGYRTAQPKAVREVTHVCKVKSQIIPLLRGKAVGVQSPNLEALRAQFPVESASDQGVSLSVV